MILGFCAIVVKLSILEQTRELLSVIIVSGKICFPKQQDGPMGATLLL